MKVQRYGFKAENVIEVASNKIDWRMNLAMILLAALCILTSMMVIPGIREVTLDPVVSVVANKTEYIKLVLGGLNEN